MPSKLPGERRSRKRAVRNHAVSLVPDVTRPPDEGRPWIAKLPSQEANYSRRMRMPAESGMNARSGPLKKTFT